MGHGFHSTLLNYLRVSIRIYQVSIAPWKNLPNWFSLGSSDKNLIAPCGNQTWLDNSHCFREIHLMPDFRLRCWLVKWGNMWLILIVPPPLNVGTGQNLWISTWVRGMNIPFRANLVGKPGSRTGLIHTHFFPIFHSGLNAWIQIAHSFWLVSDYLS